MPSSCRNGTCRICMCRMAQGAVRYKIEWPGLSSDEKEEGWILPCVALAEADLVLDSPYAYEMTPAQGGAR
jgi:ferredoxin